MRSAAPGSVFSDGGLDFEYLVLWEGFPRSEATWEVSRASAKRPNLDPDNTFHPTLNTHQPPPTTSPAPTS